MFDLAERAYREALRLDPELAEARHDMGVIRLEQRRYAEALEHLVEAAALDPAGTDSARTISDGLRRLVRLRRRLVADRDRAGGLPGPGRAGLLPGLRGAGRARRRRCWCGATSTRVPGLLRTILPGLLRADRTLALAVYAVAAAPVLLLLYALVGTPWPLVAAIAVAAVAEFAVFARSPR